MTRPISRHDFELLLKKIATEHNVSEEIVRQSMMEKLEEADLFIQEAPLAEQIRHAQVLAGEQVVVNNLRQLEAGIKPKGPPLVEQVRHARVNIAEQMCCDFVRNQIQKT